MSTAWKCATTASDPVDDRSGRGLTGLAERVAAAGGVIQIAAASGGGTSIRVNLAPSSPLNRRVP